MPNVSRRVCAVALLGALAVTLSTNSARQASAQPASALTKAPATGATKTAVYAAVTRSGGRDYLRLVSQSTGTIVATLASGKHDPYSYQGYFSDIDLARDGSVYAIAPDTSLPTSYQTRLMRYTTKGATKLQPYIRSVKESPDGKRLATTALSPDGDGDGYGLEALRISNAQGIKVKDLMTSKVPVWKNSGSPAVNAGGSRVLGWLPNTNLAVETGCCDSGWAWVASSTKTAAVGRGSLRPRGKSLQGTFGTTIIGYRGNSVLGVQMDHNEPRPYTLRWGTARNYEGKVAARLSRYDRLATAELARKHGATPLGISPKTYPYRGPGVVVRASL